MVPLKPPFDSSALSDLKERIQYEDWLLEAAYSIASQDLFPTYPDGVIFALNNPIPHHRVYASGNCIIGDWRPKFLQVGAPLVFVSIFKLLDMFIEWVLSNNGKKVSYRFKDKLNSLDVSIVFPEPIESNAWLKERLVGFYRTLEPLRGTIIHDRYFTSTDGTLSISSSKQGTVGQPLNISGDQLRRFAKTIISVIRYVDRTWHLDDLKKRAVKHDLDELQTLHGLGTMGQKHPTHVGVRVYSDARNAVLVDIPLLRNSVFGLYQNQDCSFDIRLLLVDDGKVVEAYHLPWSIISETEKSFRYIDELQQYEIPIPDDIEPEHIQIPVSNM